MSRLRHKETYPIITSLSEIWLSIDNAKNGEWDFSYSLNHDGETYDHHVLPYMLKPTYVPIAGVASW